MVTWIITKEYQKEKMHSMDSLKSSSSLCSHQSSWSQGESSTTEDSLRRTSEGKMKAAVVLSHSLTPLPSRTDFISNFLLPLFCHSWAKLMGSWLLPGLQVQARGISAWKAPSESECHRMRKGKTKKQQLTIACCIQAPHIQSHPWQECQTHTT